MSAGVRQPKQRQRSTIRPWRAVARFAGDPAFARANCPRVEAKRTNPI
jgi:hypothetical protein